MNGLKDWQRLEELEKIEIKLCESIKGFTKRLGRLGEKEIDLCKRIKGFWAIKRIRKKKEIGLSEKIEGFAKRLKGFEKWNLINGNRL